MRELSILNQYPIDHLIGRTIRLLEPLRRSIDPSTAEDAKEAWEAWKKVRKAVVISTNSKLGGRT